MIAITVDHADYALRLGQAADAVIESDDATANGASLPTPQQAIDALEAVDRPPTVAPLSAQRLLKLAASCSQHAAVSSRLELYPLGMAAQRAIRIAMGSLIGPRVLTEAQVRERILGRYPDAEDLPARPTLDSMLIEAGSDLIWHKDGEDGSGYYPSHKGFGPSAGTTTFLHRPGTAADDKKELTEEEAAARQFDEKLTHALKAGGFLVLTTSPRLARHAEAALQRRLASSDFLPVSLDHLILQSLKEEAVQRKVDWSKVIEADVAGPGSRDWTNVIRLASFAKGANQCQAHR
ncbi:MAG: hypothetical protein IPG23_13255 [Burkholderiales bacterium]|nr:hypothetical protein [Burkholderiales bacterium]